MKYNWDLTKIFKDETEIDDAYSELFTLLDELETYKGKVLKSASNLSRVLYLDERIDYLSEKIYVYSNLAYYSDMANSKYRELTSRADNMLNKLRDVTSFLTPELMESDFESVKKIISEDSSLEKYTHSLERIYRYKEHTLSKEEERILSNVADSLDSCEDAFSQLDNTDLNLGYMKDENGKRVKLTNHNFTTMLSSKNERVRKTAFKKLYNYFKEHINTISSLYLGNIKADCFYAKTKKYKNSLVAHLYPDNVNEELYKNLIKVTNNNVKSLQKYYKTKGKSINKKLHMYDMYLNTSTLIEEKIPYEEGVKICNKALDVLGEYYLEKFNYIINNRSVDVYPKDNKRSGAYQWGVYAIDPYVSLNYEENIDSVSTLIHEMGHAMHSYLSDTNQDYIYAGYSIFLAEIASTVNEILLSNYLIKNCKTKEEKIYYLVEFLDKFKATVFRQVMFAEFEYLTHKNFEEGKAITKDYFCNLYYDLNKKQFGNSLVVDKEIQYEWARIPHFYTSFYVYKYATGFISALVIADKLTNEKDFKDKYIKFLSSGNTKYPLELLKELDIDLCDEKTLDKAFKLFDEKVDELNKLVSENE